MQQKNTRDIITIALAFFFVFLGAGAAQPFVVDFLREGKGLSPGLASSVLAGVYFTIVVFWLITGRIARRIGLHGIKLIGVSTYTLFPLIIYAAGSYPLLLTGSLIWGIGAPMLWMGGMVQVMNSTTPSKAGTATGMVKGAEMTGSLLGAYILSYLYVRHGYEVVFLLAAALGLAGFTAMAFSPNRPIPEEKLEAGNPGPAPRQQGRRIIFFLLLCSGFAYGIILNGVKPHIEAVCGSHWLEWILPLFAVTGILSSVLGGRICDRIGRWRTFRYAFAAGAGGMFLAAWTQEPLLLMIAMLGIGIQNALVPLAAFGWIADNTPPEHRSGTMGFIMCYRDLGIALSIQFGGFFSNTVVTFIFFGVISAICCAMAFQDRLFKTDSKAV